MKKFKIYEKQGVHEAVKQGWSWPAFFFGIIWAFVKNLWLIGFGFFAMLVVFMVLGRAAFADNQEAMDSMTAVLAFTVALVFGYKGNEWRQARYASKKFHFKGTVSAANSSEARAVYSDNRSTESVE
jgi:hypothetical protein